MLYGLDSLTESHCSHSMNQGKFEFGRLLAHALLILFCQKMFPVTEQIPPLKYFGISLTPHSNSLSCFCFHVSQSVLVLSVYEIIGLFHRATNLMDCFKFG